MQKESAAWSVNQRFKINEEIPVVIYGSNRTRLKVAIAKTPGPLVKGVFSFVTETHDDDGLPHTLEHLTFLGSEKCPYKGTLDLLANRCLASGTNAFTQQDHTGYELTTVGSQGFLNVLPIYLNHLLSPLLTDAQFITEVHHINGQGEDVGVVYSEMQDYESEMSQIVSWKRRELFYPEYNPYRVEVGGRLSALRTTCNMDKIRRYHHDFYHISNMFVIICGSIDHLRVLHLLSNIEDKSQQQVPHLFNCPFKNPMLTFTKPATEKIVCPSEDEKLGMVEIAWNGPANNLLDLQRLEVLGHYLCDTAAAPLEQDYVQLKEQLASSVYFYVKEQCVSEIVLGFTGVPVSKIGGIKRRLFEKTFPVTFETKFDKEHMKNTINHLIDRQLSAMETHCHDSVFRILIMHQIYGTETNMNERINYVGQLRKMLNMHPDDWINLRRAYLTKNCVCVMGYPSRKEVDRIAALEKDRIEKQRQKLGPSGLRECDEKLKKAIYETTRQKPPTDLLNALMVKNLENFATFNVKTLHALTAQNNAEIFKLPLPVYVHSTQTHFVEFSLVWDTRRMSEELRMWLMVYFELLFQSPAVVDDEEKSYEEVAKLFTRDLISYYGGIGMTGRFNRFFSITLKASPTRYVTMLSWLKTFVIGLIFEAERVKVAVQKLVAEADEEKRDGSDMCDTLLTTAIHDKSSNTYMYGVIQLEKFHESVLKQAEENPSSVVRKLEEVRVALLTAPVNVHIVCDTDRIMPFLPLNLGWLYKNYTCGHERSEEFKNSPGDSLASDWLGKQRVIAVASCESSFLEQSVKFMHDWGSEEVLSVQLIAQYLSQAEGPLWKALRGKGLAYGVQIGLNPDKQLLNFSIYRSAHLEEAYEQAKKVVFNELEHMDGNEFEAAKRSFVSEIVQSEDTVNHAARRAIRNQFRGLSSHFWREYCERIWKASMEKVLECGSDFIRELFDDGKCCRAIAVPHGKLKDIKSHFKGIEVIQTADLQIKVP